MTPRHRILTLVVISLSALSSGCAHEREQRRQEPRPSAAGIPASLEAPQTQELILAARGAGAQIYECQAGKAGAPAFAWTLIGPEAVLHYQAGKDLGRHYAGPTWEANDGSKVVGEMIAHVDGTDPTAIPWLLLRATQTEGSGVFGRVQSIQRLHTVGGKAPTTGCDANYAGTQTRVAYSADYYFYGQRP